MNDEYEGRKAVGKTSYALRRDLGFKRGTYGRETRDSGSAPSSLLVTGKNFFLLKIPTLSGVEPETAACKVVTPAIAPQRWTEFNNILF